MRLDRQTDRPTDRQNGMVLTWVLGDQNATTTFDDNGNNDMLNEQQLTSFALLMSEKRITITNNMKK